MRDAVRAYIKKFQLLSDDRPVLVGFSGGADSVALLTLLVKLGYSCIGAHCNFHLRGDESVRDEQFAMNFASSLGVPFYKIDFDTNRYAEEHHLSIEMAARELRYGWFEDMRVKLGAQAIAVAHHRDDSIETLFMNLIRGTGIRGMSGIRPRNGYVVRPLLAVSRDEILKWLSGQHLSYVTDSTNLSDIYTRNFIRLRVIPLLEEINPSVKVSIARTMEHLAAAETIYMQVVEDARKHVVKEEGRFSISALMGYPSPDTILYELLKPYNFTPAVVDDLFQSLTKESGKLFYSVTHRLVKDREFLLLAPIEKQSFHPYLLEREEDFLYAPIKLSCHKIVINENYRIQKDKNIAYFDCAKLTFPLTLRTWKEGDWFIPFGMKGRKKLSDYFSDRKYSRLDKECAWLLCCGDDIVWIVGERPDDRFCLDKTTKSVLVVNFFSTKRIV